MSNVVLIEKKKKKKIPVQSHGLSAFYVVEMSNGQLQLLIQWSLQQEILAVTQVHTPKPAAGLVSVHTSPFICVFNSVYNSPFSTDTVFLCLHLCSHCSNAVIKLLLILIYISHHSTHSLFTPISNCNNCSFLSLATSNEACISLASI